MAYQIADAQRIDDAWRELAVRRFGAPAIVDDSGEISYSELEEMVESVAAGLHRSGIGAGDTILLILPRGKELAALILACLRLGATFVPLDPHSPSQHLLGIASAARPSLVVCLDQFSKYPTISPTSLLSNEAAKEVSGSPVSPTSAAYVMFTSGTSGVPKGAQVSEASLINLLTSFKRSVDFQESDTLFSLTTPSFDIFLLELLLPLVSGGTVVLLSRTRLAGPEEIRQELENRSWTILQGTPTVLQSLLDAGWSPNSSQRVICGGEAMTPKLAEGLGSMAGRLWNAYGPTETTIWSTLHLVEEIEDGRWDNRIGKPIDGTLIRILSANGTDCAPGQTGELHIGGAGVALGYLDASSTQSPFYEFDSSPFYQTGDQVSIDHAGVLSYHGRLDRQVKIRGTRVELGDVEERIAAIAGVKAVLAAIDDNRLLEAFVVLGHGTSPAAVRTGCLDLMPTSMIPTHVYQLEALPTNQRGKVDLEAARKSAYEMRSGVAGEAVSTERQISVLRSQVAQIWSEVLEHPTVGGGDNFFDLGGHSLLALRLVSRYRLDLTVEVPVRKVFELQTVDEHVTYLLELVVGDNESTER